MNDMTLHPIRHLLGPLMWTHDGTVWVVLHVDPIHYPHATPSDATAIADSTAALLRSLRGEPMLLSLAGQTDATAVVERMIAGIDLDTCPGWAEQATATLDTLDGVELRRRSSWLCLPLPHGSRTQAAGAVLAGAATRATRSLGLVPPAVSAAEATARLRQVDKLLETLPAHGSLRPATPGEILWIHARSARCGAIEPLLDVAEASQLGVSQLRGGLLRGPSLGYLNEVHLDEGGRATGRGTTTDQPTTGGGTAGRLARSLWGGLRGQTDTRTPFEHRFLKVTTPDGGVSYQALMAVADLPAEWRFPGGEWLAELDRVEVPIDWVARLRVVSRSKALAGARRKERELADQIGEFTGDDDPLQEPPEKLHDAVDGLHSYVSHLDALDGEVELQTGIALRVFADTQAECEQRAELVRLRFNDEYRIVRPTGAQTALYSAFVPGTPTPKVLARHYVQYLLAADLAKAAPFAATGLGDQTGALFGFGLDSGIAQPVLLDPASWTRQNASASMGLFGELGGGKSMALKHLTAALGDRGAATFTWDHTTSLEWVRFIRAVFPDSHQIIEIGGGADAMGASLDPLRSFPGRVGEELAEAFFTVVFGITSADDRGAVLAETIEKVGARSDRCMAAVVDELGAASGGDDHAATLYRLLRVNARKRLAQAVFDRDLPALNFADQHVVFATHGLPLPSRGELASERQMDRLPFEKRLGRGLLYLTFGASKAVAFADPAQFYWFAHDECWRLTAEGHGSPGHDAVLEIIRDGRKHAVGLGLASQDPDDVGSDTSLGLLGAIAAFRYRDRDLAAKAVRVLGRDSGSEDGQRLLRTLTGLSPIGHDDRAGECLLLDVQRRLGLMQVVTSPAGRVDAQIRTTPPAAGPDGRVAERLPAGPQGRA